MFDRQTFLARSVIFVGILTSMEVFHAVVSVVYRKGLFINKFSE
jgi:hypothetical protein